MQGVRLRFVASYLRDTTFYSAALAFIVYGVAGRDVTPLSLALVTGGGALFSFVVNVAEWRDPVMHRAHHQLVERRAA